MAVLTIYHCTAINGGAAGALDAINGDWLLDGDRGFVVTSAGVFSVWWLDADYNTPDNGTTIIAPDSNAGTKRWRKCT